MEYEPIRIPAQNIRLNMEVIHPVNPEEHYLVTGIGVTEKRHYDPDGSNFVIVTTPKGMFAYKYNEMVTLFLSEDTYATMGRIRQDIVRYTASSPKNIHSKLMIRFLLDEIMKSI